MTAVLAPFDICVAVPSGLNTKVNVAAPVLLLAVNGLPVPNVALISAGDTGVEAASVDGTHAAARSSEAAGVMSLIGGSRVDSLAVENNTPPLRKVACER